MVTQYGAFHSPVGSPFGWIRLTCSDGALVALDFDAPPPSDQSDVCAPGMLQAMAWLTAYFTAKDAPDMPDNMRGMTPKGTAFQQRVWSALRDVPWGQCITYAELARRVGSAPRAVGGALRANPIPILIPCHRVVAAAGLGGYAGAGELGQARKSWLLSHEGVQLT
ncbi:MAG: hypothetical protein B7Y40_08705 [Gammaproteobacteria bacterium 28-57-27]|nr:MAG: hypothetical protein B7Y40_08705 [Gammaproteobacteria bacterium 28-57-27]